MQRRRQRYSNIGDRGFLNADTCKHLGTLRVCVILLYFPAAVLDYVSLFSGNWGVVPTEKANSTHIFYGPWQICWVVEHSFFCKNYSWRSTLILPSMLLLFSVIVGKIILLGSLYQLLNILKYKWYVTMKISVILKVVLCVLSLILHISAVSLSKNITEEKKLVYLWNSEIAVFISTGLVVVMMLVLLYELFFIVKVARPAFENDSDFLTDGFMNPSYRNRSPVRTGSSEVQTGANQNDSDTDFTLKDLSVMSDVISENKRNGSLNDNVFSSDDCQDDGIRPNSFSDPCTAGYLKRDFKTKRGCKRATVNKEMYDTATFLEMASSEPNVSGIGIKRKNNNKLPSPLGIKLRHTLVQNIEDGHELVPLNQTVLLLQRNTCQDWEFNEMKAYKFQNLSTSDTELVIFEFKNNASQQDITEMNQHAENFNDETTEPSYPYYFPHTAEVPCDNHLSKCNLALPTAK